MKRLTQTAIILLLALTTGACTSFREVIADGPVEEDYGVRTRGMALEDKDIESKININVRFSKALQNANIQVTSYNRIVLLTGQVANADARLQAADIAQKTRHVRRIHNELTVGETLPLLGRSADSLLHTKVNARLLAAQDIDSGRIVVVVEDGAVYLMGLVSKAESQRAIDAIREVSGINKIVKVFEYID